jgi:asparagine synthase (glutamine-hydrolysing)
MCGICGFVLKELMEPFEITKAIERMTQTLRHRGPDGQGIRIISPPLVPSPVALGHRRLAIIDLSESGAQPMSNEDETIWVVFNGEIYNFQELRQGLLMKGHRFRSRTDTEVLVHLYE